jgi:hypothetical protein
MAIRGIGQIELLVDPTAATTLRLKKRALFLVLRPSGRALEPKIS